MTLPTDKTANAASLLANSTEVWNVFSVYTATRVYAKNLANSHQVLMEMDFCLMAAGATEHFVINANFENKTD
jgi:hypothetical protein